MVDSSPSSSADVIVKSSSVEDQLLPDPTDSSRSKIGFFSRLIAIVVLSVFVTGGILYYVFVYGPQSQANVTSAQIKINTVVTVNTQSPIGKINKDSLGVNAPMVKSDPQKNYFWTVETEGIEVLKRDLGISSLRFIWETNDWKNPYEPIGANKLEASKFYTVDELQHIQAIFNGPSYYVVNSSKLCIHKPEISPPPKRAPKPPINMEDAEQNKADAICTDLLKGIGSQQTLDLIRYVKKRNLYPLTYIEIGNEAYASNFAFNPYKPKYKAEEYIKRLNKWYDDIKKIDPLIQVGANLVNRPEHWAIPVLKNGKYDFLSVHQYSQVDRMPTQEDGTKLSFYDLQNRYHHESPEDYRKLLIQHRPDKVNIPIIVSEFEATIIRSPDEDGPLSPLHPDHCGTSPCTQPGYPADNNTNTIRSTLYAAFSTVEMYLDLLWPVMVNGQRYEGAKAAYLLGISTPWVNKMSEWSNPSNTIYFPVWHALSFLKQFHGKDILETTIETNPPLNTVGVGKPALKAYTVKSEEEKLFVLVLNHHPTKTIIFDLYTPGYNSLSPVKVLELGNSPSVHFTTNGMMTPIRPQARTIIDTPQTNIKNNRIKNIDIPPHTIMLLEVERKR